MLKAAAGSVEASGGAVLNDRSCRNITEGNAERAHRSIRSPSGALCCCVSVLQIIVFVLHLQSVLICRHPSSDLSNIQFNLSGVAEFFYQLNFSAVVNTLYLDAEDENY